MDRKSILRLIAFLLRILTLGGRFVFILVAIQFMGPREFGIYGLIASAAFLIIQVVGLEAYQTTLRQIAQDGPEYRGDQRANYGRLVLVSASLSFAAGIVFAAYFGWSIPIVLMSGAVIASEYIGSEVSRILVSENRPELAMYSISVRYIPWNLGLPMLTLLGITTHLSIELVLGTWLFSSILGTAFILPVSRDYFFTPVSQFTAWYTQTLLLSPRWLVIALCWRFLENGTRLIPGFVMNEQAAGQFAFLATLASVGSTGLKAAVEPFWHVRMIREPGSGAARRSFALISAVWLAIGSLASAVAMWALSYFGFKEESGTDNFILALLILSSSFLALSQIPHFKLYLEHRDNVVQNISACILAISLFSTTIMTMYWGLYGTAAGTLLGTSLLFTIKCSYAYSRRTSKAAG